MRSCSNISNRQHVFKMEQEEYTKEEIDWSYIEFVDNQDVLDLIEKILCRNNQIGYPGYAGLIPGPVAGNVNTTVSFTRTRTDDLKPAALLLLWMRPGIMFPRSTNEIFAGKLYQTFKDNKRLSKPKLSRSDFTVTYQTELFLDKNKDYVVPEHAALLSASNCSFVSGLFPPLPEDTTKSTKFSSVATQFKQQLQSLLETLSATEPHYIRCVKPNNLLKPGIFENINVLQQLRFRGVMEAIRLMKSAIQSPEDLTACNRILDKANLKDYQIGKTKVFLRAGQMAELDACRAEVLGRSATVIQRNGRTYICRRYYVSLRLCAIELQRVTRGIQGMVSRNDLRIRKRFLSHSRGYLARTRFRRLKKATIVVQCSWRRTFARRELRKLKMYVGSSLDKLKHATHAVRFLVVRQKNGLSYDDLTNDLCPVTTSLKFLMTYDEEGDSKSFLLEDNSSIPIIVEEISSSLKENTIPKVKPPADLLQNPAFHFLLDYR
ncbi:hypothetical protein Lal_00014681 [Lupinus albus]|nr:hypothetical protein Lal_00014681 [Lupinus albus]